MSQCYHVELSASVSRVVRGEDSVSYPVELTQILPEGEMAEILLEKLLNSGWVADDDSSARLRKPGSAGEAMVLDLEAMELSASLTSEKQVSSEVTVSETSEIRKQAETVAEARLEAERNALADQLENSGNRELQREVTRQLTDSESDRQRLMNELLQQVYAEALKRKARQLGDVLEVSESMGEDGNYELKIRIEQ